MSENQISGKFQSSSQYKREKFSQKQNGIILSTNAIEVTSKNKILAVNDYFFLKTIGHGSFGEVKLATKDLIEDDYREDHQRFAIKMLKRMTKRKSTFSRSSPKQSQLNQVVPINDDNLQIIQHIPEQVQKEINIMKVLVHPNLVQLLEIINSPESLYVYLVLEYIDGGPIMKYNSTTKKFLYRLTNTTMGESTARKSFTDLLSGLSFMHSHHIAHRDLKPDNLLVDFHGNLKISDFGVSILFEKDTHKSSVSLKYLKSSTSRGMSSHTEGTFPFFSPEMCSNDSNSAYSAYLSDMWAASVCLWIFIFGELPFYHTDLSVLFDLIRECNLKWPHNVSPELNDFLTRCLIKDQKKRLYIMEAQEHCWITGTLLDKSNFTNYNKLTSINSLEKTTPIQETLSKSTSFNNSQIEKKNENLTPHQDNVNVINRLTYRQKQYIRQLVKKVRLKCQERHETIVMNLKKEVNSLVSSMLKEITREGIGVIDENYKNFKKSLLVNKSTNSESKDLIIDENESVNSDPLAELVTDVRETSQTSLSINNSSFNTNLKKNSINITKFTHLDVLSSLRDDEMKRNSQIFPSTTNSQPITNDVKGYDVNIQYDNDPDIIYKAIMIREMKLAENIANSGSILNSPLIFQQLYSLPCDPIPLSKMLLHAQSLLQKRKKKDFSIDSSLSSPSPSPLSYQEEQDSIIQFLSGATLGIDSKPAVSAYELSSMSVNFNSSIVSKIIQQEYQSDIDLMDILSSLSEVASSIHNLLLNHILSLRESPEDATPQDFVSNLVTMPNDQGRNILHFLALSGGTTLVTDLLNFFNQTYTSGLDTLKMGLTSNDLRGYIPLHYAVMRYGQNSQFVDVFQSFYDWLEINLSEEDEKLINILVKSHNISINHQKIEELSQIVDDKQTLCTENDNTCIDSHLSDNNGGWNKEYHSNPFIRGNISRCDILEVFTGLPSAEEFFQNYLLKGIPVIFRNALNIQNHPILSILEKNTFQEEFGEDLIPISEIPYAKTFGKQDKLISFNQFIELLDDNQQTTKDSNTPTTVPLYAFNVPLSQWKHRIEEEIGVPSIIKDLIIDYEMQFYLGSSGTGAPVHYHGHAVNSLAYGEKRWFLYPPENSFYSTKPSLEFVQYDKKQYNSLQCHQKSGDVMYVPSLWGHGTLNTKQSIGVAHEFSIEDVCME